MILTLFFLLSHVSFLRSEYLQVDLLAPQILGPGDQVTVRALHVPELSDKPARIDESGAIQLPLAGQIRAKGLRPDELAALIRSKLENLVREPQVTVEVTEWKSRAVSVLGAVKTPGVYQVQGDRRLLEVLSMAGGIDPDAGVSLRISRYDTSGHHDPLFRSAGDSMLAEIGLERLLEVRRPEYNVLIRPRDVIVVQRAKLVYVIGEVRRAGGFTLRERESMTVLQALSMAEGLTITAAANRARILRGPGEGDRKEVAVDVKKILAGKGPDVPMQPNDILFIPKSTGRTASLRAAETALSMGTGLVIWRR